MFRSAELSGQIRPGYSSGQAIAAMERLSKDLPRGFGYEWTGLAYQEKLAGGQAGYIFAFSVLFVFLTLAALYESWAIPIGVLLGLPITVFGALSGVWLRGLANDVYVQVGIVMLIGLNAKLSIMIVEFAKNKRDLEGYSTFDGRGRGGPAALSGRPYDRPGRSLRADDPGIVHRRRRRRPLVGGHCRRFRHGHRHALSLFFIPVLYYAVQTVVDKLQGVSRLPRPESNRQNLPIRPAAGKGGAHETVSPVSWSALCS